MFKTTLATALIVAVNAGTEAEALWDTSVNGPFSTNTCAGELATLAVDAKAAWDYMAALFYCNNAAYVAAGVSGNVCAQYASASYGYLAKAVGTAGKSMTFCFANPRWGPCYAFGGYTNAHLGSALYNGFAAYT